MATGFVRWLAEVASTDRPTDREDTSRMSDTAKCPGSETTDVRPARPDAEVPWPPAADYRYACEHCGSVRFMRTDGLFPNHQPNRP